MAYFITDTCIGCTVCELKCPVDTISGRSKELYVIHPEGCIDCGVCAIYCPVSCIQDQYGNLVTRIKPSQIPKAKVIVDDCTGCEFCVDICPFDCIYMKEDPTHTGTGSLQGGRGRRGGVRGVPVVRDRVRQRRDHRAERADPPGGDVAASVGEALVLSNE